MNLFAALISGLLFGAGLVVSDMVNPARVLAFLDVAGAWDPSLALVMAGALVPAFVADRLRRRLDRPLCAAQFHVPQQRQIDPRLVAGAAVFGIGWGLVGFCPGPALAALARPTTAIAWFVLALLAGMGLHRLLHDRRP